MIAVTVKIVGADAAAKALGRTADDLTGPPMINGMRQATGEVTFSARRNAPSDTGHLRSSILPEVVATSREVRGIVGSNVLYAPYMELGTGIFAGRKPHWPPSWALEVWARRHGFSSGYVVARAIGLRGGLRPRKYLENALTQNAERIYQLVGAVVGRIIAR